MSIIRKTAETEHGMNFPAKIGIYLIVVTAVSTLTSLWQIYYGSGKADFSFLLIVPFAVGLLRNRKWALDGSSIVGILSSSLAVFMSLVQTLSPSLETQLRYGPFVLTNPAPLQVWMFSLAYLTIIGVPMMSVLFNRKKGNAES